MPKLSTDPAYYREGTFRWGDRFTVVVTIEKGRWHLSISHPARDLTYQELKRARYRFCPPDVVMAQMFPPVQEWVNVHEFCFHLWEVHENHQWDGNQNPVAIALQAERVET